MSPLASKSALTPLDDYERDFRARLRDLQLIGELSLIRDELDALCQHIREHQFRGSIINGLIRDFPATFATFLVFTGVYDYEAGAFWPSAMERLGRPPQSLGPENTVIGRFFEDFTKEHQLETFNDFPANAQRYLSRFLAHGGVPEYCLPDFFNLLAHALARPDWASLPPDVLIDEWQARRYGFLQIDIPVQRFLNYGGSVALDFLQRSLDLVAQSLDTGTVPDSYLVGLPSRITEACAAWLGAQGADEIGRSAPRIHRARLAPPELVLDPWARDGLLVEFPSQKLPRRYTKIEWLVRAGGQQISVVPRAHLSPDSTTLRPTSAQIRTPSTHFEIVLRADGKDLGDWNFRGVSPDRPIMVFDSNSGGLLRWTKTLPARDLWILVPGQRPEVTTQSGGKRPVPVLEEFPRLVAGWQNFRSYHVELSECHTLEISNVEPQARPITLPIDAAAAILRPSLVTNEISVRGVETSDGSLPVLSASPRVAIPLADLQELARPELWSITVVPARGAIPQDRLAERVSDLAWTAPDDRTIEVDLQQSKLLPTTAFGAFSATVLGPLGRDARFDFALVPGLEVYGRENPLQLGQTGDSVKFRIVASCPLHFSSASQDTVVQDDGTGLLVATRESDVTLHVTPDVRHPLGVGDGTPLELSISAPILRWAVLGFERRQTLGWASLPIRISRAELDAAADPALLIEGYRVKDRQSRRQPGGIAEITLRTSDRAVLQRESVDMRGDRVWLSLAKFKDTIRSRPDAGLEVAVDFWGETGQRFLADIIVLRVVQTLTVKRFMISEQRLNPTLPHLRYLTATWDQTHSITNRELRLWSLTRLWAAPIRIAIPDEQDGSFSFSVPMDHIPPGRYRFEMAVVDPWAIGSSLPQMPLPPSDSGGGQRSLLDMDIGAGKELEWYLQSPATTMDVLIDQAMQRQEPLLLRGLAPLLADEDLHAPLKVFEDLIAAEDADVLKDERWLEAAIIELREVLSEHPQLIQTLASFVMSSSEGAGDSINESSNRPIQLLAALGIPQASPRRLASDIQQLTGPARWTLVQAFPLLLLASMDGGVAELERNAVAAERLFGQAGLELLVPTVSDRAALDSGEADLGLSAENKSAILGQFARRIEPTEFRISFEQLRSIRETLQLLPRGLLDADAFDLATFHWLVPLKDPRNEKRRDVVERWVAETVPQFERLHMQLREVLLSKQHDVSCLHLASDIVLSRRHSSYAGIERLPFAVGFTALVQRLAARLPSVSREIGLSSAAAIDWGRQSAVFAPRLYARDLCTFDILLLRHLSQGQSHQHDLETMSTHELDEHELESK